MPQQSESYIRQCMFKFLEDVYEEETFAGIMYFGSKQCSRKRTSSQLCMEVSWFEDLASSPSLYLPEFLHTQDKAKT